MQQPLTFQGLHIRQPLLAFLGFPRLWFKLVSLIGADERIRTSTPFRALVPKTSVAAITPHPRYMKQVSESNRRSKGYEPEWDTASYLHKLWCP
jgi:hypothetical protein